jgi:DNA-binding MarR family transcriptional regulator
MHRGSRPHVLLSRCCGSDRRQAASKIVAELRGDGHVRTTASSTDQRGKVVELTQQAIAYVTPRLRAAVDIAICTRLGDDGFDKLREALQAVG